VVNVVNEDLAEAMNISSGTYPPETDEFKETGLTPEMGDIVKAPMVFEAPVKMECRLNQVLEFGEALATNRFVIGEVVCIHIKDEVFYDDEIQMSELKAVGRLGGRGADQYCRISDSFEIKRPA
ncbi:flavin reductase family protein, partial [Chloroflexota bacterium]